MAGSYTLVETVGQGTFGEVMLAKERHTRESVAVKILEKSKIVDDDARQRLVNEILILQRVQHANLVQLLEVIDEPDCIYLVTEFVGGGELFSYIVNKGRLDEAEASRLFAQMVAAVDSCHRQLVIHRDLKPENVLLDANGDIKVIDFGLGTILNYADEVLTVACGSPHYAAPEMLLGNGYLGQRADMWSLGVCLCAPHPSPAHARAPPCKHSCRPPCPPTTLTSTSTSALDPALRCARSVRRYAMVCGCLPFDEPEMDVLYDRIIEGQYDFSPAPHLSAACRDLICGLLRSPPEERLTARAVLSHKWMRSTAPPSSSLSNGLVGAIVDPACKHLVQRMQNEYGHKPHEVIEHLRKGERSPLTATYWLLRQRELKHGRIKQFAAHLPRPPPPRQPTQRHWGQGRRPVPANIRAAAAKLPAVTSAQVAKDALRSLPAFALGTQTATVAGPGSMTHRSGGRYDDAKNSPGSIVQRPREEAPLFVHQSGALSDRTDRDGHSRRLHELEQGPVRRANQTRSPVGVGGVTATVRQSHIHEISVTGSARGVARAGPPSSYRTPYGDSPTKPRGSIR